MKNLDEMITGKIEEYVEQSDKNPYEINDGFCEELAMYVLRSDELRELYDNSEIYELTTAVVDKKCPEEPSDFPGHVWIYNSINDKHYDAEVPDGVDGFSYLPFFQRIDITIDDIHPLHKDDF